MNIKKIIKMYEKQNKSTYEIAEHFETYPNKIRRILKKHGCELRDKNAAQKAALATGRAPHPTKGKERTLEERVKISQSVTDYWEEMSEKERVRRSKDAKKRWKEMSEEQRETMRRRSTVAIQKAAKEGSKLERVIVERLRNEGYSVESHKTNLIPTEKLEIDLYLKDLGVIIEVDGPSHFLPIWGQEKLEKQVSADLKKNGVLLTRGFVVIRVKVLDNETVSRREELISNILDMLKKIEKKKPVKSKRFIEVEL